MSTINTFKFNVVNSLNSMGGSSPLLLVDLHNNNNNFYSLAENKVVSLGGEYDGCGSDPTAADVIMGSSRGWLGLMSQDNLELFLWNPISHRRVDLPSIHNLSIPPKNLEGRFGCVEKLIVSSSSPGDADCRAVLSYYGPGSKLAFCIPGHSADWITICGPRYEGGHRIYSDFAFSTRQNRLFCITQLRCLELECWDLEDPFSPRIDKIEEYESEADEEPELEDDDDKGNDEDDDNEGDEESEDDEGEDSGEPHAYLVVAEQDHCNQEQLFIVVRNIHYGGDWKNRIKKTIDFDVHKIVRRDGGENVKYVYVESLDGLSIFVGINECIALSAAEFPELKPDSIYFTDPREVEHRPSTFRWWNSSYGLSRYDIGIYDYIHKVFYPCYCPPKLKEDEEPKPEPEPEEDGNPKEEVSSEEVGREGLEDGAEEDDEDEEDEEYDWEELPLIVWFTPRP